MVWEMFRKVLGISILSVFSMSIYADQCFFANTKNNIQKCTIDEGFSAGTRKVVLNIANKEYLIAYEHCQNELSEQGCNKAEIQVNGGATLKAKSYLRNGQNKQIISDQQWSSSSFDCVKSLNNKVDICWN